MKDELLSKINFSTLIQNSNLFQNSHGSDLRKDGNAISIPRLTPQVAAPTASLHFDAALLEALVARGVVFTHVTLHVGAGTFLPVKVEDVTTHKMHAEWGQVREQAAAEIAATKREGRKVVPVGTTALRLIETAGRGGTITAWQGDTDIFIYPGFTFQVADALMTNFHLPKSTLIMLVSALMGYERVKSIYAHAIAEQYRFFSYGDASLLLPERAERPNTT